MMARERNWWETKVDKFFDWFSGPGFKRWAKSFFNPPSPDPQAVKEVNERRPSNPPPVLLFVIIFLAVALGVYVGSSIHYQEAKADAKREAQQVMSEYRKLMGKSPWGN